VTMTLEDRLRDAYQAAAQTVRPDTIRPGVQYRRTPATRRASRFHGRFSTLAPLAAAAAVVAAIAIPHLAAGSGHHPPGAVTTPATIGAPPFMAELAGAPGGSDIAIQQAGTKHVTALIKPPHGATYWDAVAATNDTTFIAATTTFSDRVYSSALYRLTLSAAGKLSTLTPLRSGIAGEITALASSQAGRIAYAALPGSSKPTTLGVVTGTTIRQWTAPAEGGPGSTVLLAGSLSLTADGNELGFITFRIADTVGPVRAGGTMWLLPVDSAPGSATNRGHMVTTGPPGSAPLSAVLSADGRTLYVLSTRTSTPGSASSGRPESVTLSAYSAVDGILLRTVRTWTDIPDSAITGPGVTIGGGQLLIWGIGGTSAYQVDPITGVTKPVWVYSVHDNDLSSGGSSIAW
jgi:hypothetical protein